MRHLDYRDVLESGFDAVSSIGLTEHIGVRNYPAYFAFLRDRLRPGGRLLNHCITRPHNHRQDIGAFIDRYVFPDGELTGSGRIITEVAERRPRGAARGEPPRALRADPRRLVPQPASRTGTSASPRSGEGTARVWGLYMAGSRLAFERNEIQLHQVLAVAPPTTTATTASRCARPGDLAEPWHGSPPTRARNLRR